MLNKAKGTGPLRHQELEAVYSISRAAAQAGNIESALDEIIRISRPVFIFDTIVLFQPRENNAIEASYARVVGRGQSAEGNLAWGEAVAHEVFHTSESQISPEEAAFLLPFLALVATAMVTGLATKHVELLYGVRVLIAIPLLVAFRRFYRDIKWSWSWSALGAGVIAAVAFVMLAPRPDAGIAGAWQQEWLGLPGWGQVSWLIVRVAGSVLVVPAAEDLAFRGYLQRRLISREFMAVPPGQFSLMALLVSSAAFGAIHHGWLGGTIAGLLFGVVQIRGKNKPIKEQQITTTQTDYIKLIDKNQGKELQAKQIKQIESNENKE